MRSKKQLVVRKTSKRIIDTRRVRYGTGMAPASIARSRDAQTHDAGTVRFGTGMAPAILRKK